MKIILAEPRGFCAGVKRAIEIVDKALEKFGKPIYVRHEIVHNKYVVENLKNKGAIFVKEVDEVPEGQYVIFSAHGVAHQTEIDAANRKLIAIDATCPLVKKVHYEAKKNEDLGKEIILIGHKGHPEVEGTSGRLRGKILLISNIADIAKIQVKDPNNLAYVTQTTLSIDDTKEIINELKKTFPKITGPNVNDICYATQNRQNAVKELAKQTELILVIGAKNSSNSNRLRDLAISEGIKSYLIDSKDNIDISWFKNINNIGITAGASAPEILVEEVVDFICQKYNATISIMDGIKENIHFNLPKICRT